MSPADEHDTDTRVILARVTTVLEYLGEGHKDHETRIRALAERPAGITPKQALAAVAAVAGIAGAIVVPFIHH